MLEVARSVLAELDLETVLERVLEAARGLTDARYAALGVLDESRSELARFLTLGIDEAERAEIGDLPRGRGVLGELIERPEPLRLAQVGRHPRSWGFPPGHPPMNAFLGVPIVVRGLPYGNLYLAEKVGGAEFSAEDEDAVVLLAEFAGVAIDHAGRYTGARTRQDELERTIATLDATTQITKAVGGETDLGVVLELIAKRGRALVSARALLVELAHGGELEVATAAGEFPAELVGERFPLAETVASAALRTRRTQRLEDELNRTRFDQHGLGRFGLEVRRRPRRAAPLPQPDVRRPARRRPARGRSALQRRGPAAARGLRGERRHGGRERDLRRRGAAPAAPRRRRGRAPALGPRAPRRDAAEPRGAPDPALHGAQGGRSPRRSTRPSASRSASSRRRSATCAR